MEAASRPTSFEHWAVQHEGRNELMEKMNWLGLDREHLAAEFKRLGADGFYRYVGEMEDFDLRRRNTDGRVKTDKYCISGPLRRLIVECGYSDPGACANTGDNKALMKQAFPKLYPKRGYELLEILRRDFNVAGTRQ